MEKEEDGQWRVGVAVSRKKQQSFLTPSLLSHALRRSLALVAVDPDLPLALQGPFHLLLHKLPTHPSWTSTLLCYASANPAVPVVDDPRAIALLHNRASMLEAASAFSSPPQAEEALGVPRQLVLEDSCSGGSDLDLDFPVIAKPLSSDGGAGTHDLALVFRKEGLLKLKFPVVLQEFVNHGGVLFKVYVIGDYVKCVKRRSLPDINRDGEEHDEDLVPFSHLSNTPYQDSQITQQLEFADTPPLRFVEDVARRLRETTRLQLFNFDLIRDSKNKNRYLVIDINYFPGYEKISSYEEVFTDFLLNTIRKNMNSS